MPLSDELAMLGRVMRLYLTVSPARRVSIERLMDDLTELIAARRSFDDAVPRRTA